VTIISGAANKTLNQRYKSTAERDGCVSNRVISEMQDVQYLNKSYIISQKSSREKRRYGGGQKRAALESFVSNRFYGGLNKYIIRINFQTQTHNRTYSKTMVSAHIVIVTQ